MPNSKVGISRAIHADFFHVGEAPAKCLRGLSTLRVTPRTLPRQLLYCWRNVIPHVSIILESVFAAVSRFLYVPIKFLSTIAGGLVGAAGRRLCLRRLSPPGGRAGGSCGSFRFPVTVRSSFPPKPSPPTPPDTFPARRDTTQRPLRPFQLEIHEVEDLFAVHQKTSRRRLRAGGAVDGDSTAHFEILD